MFLLKQLTLTLTILYSLQCTLSLAHENQLSGLLYLEPKTPQAHESFTITFELYDPEGAYIPEAIVNLSIPELEIQQSFSETTQTGIYEMRLSLPEGRWSTNLTEATFENEFNTIQFGLKVGEKNLNSIEILFPEIKKQRSQTSWIVFIGCISILSLSYLYRYSNLVTYTLA